MSRWRPVRAKNRAAFVQGDVVPDGQVVDEGEGEDGVGRAPLEEGHPLPVVPARGRARVGQVQRSGRSIASLPARARR